MLIEDSGIIAIYEQVRLHTHRKANEQFSHTKSIRPMPLNDPSSIPFSVVRGARGVNDGPIAAVRSFIVIGIYPVKISHPCPQFLYIQAIEW